MLEDYGKLSDNIVALARDVESLAVERKLLPIQIKAKEIQQKLQKDAFYIAAFGGFTK